MSPTSKKKEFFILLFIMASLSVLVTYFSIFYGISASEQLLLKYRFYRVLSALLAGFTLGFTGAYLQGSLRNPLVDHYVLGIGGGALFAVYLYVLLSTVSYFLYPAIAVLGGLLALALTITISESIGGSAVSYVLAGMGVNSLFSGLSFLLSYFILSKNPYAIQLLVGSFVLASPRYFYPTILAVALVVAGYIPLSKPLNALLLGDDYALQLGYNPRKYRFSATIIAGVSSSIIVGYYGLIGFIGLVAPHIARFLLKTGDHRYVVPISGITSSTILVITDLISREYLSSTVGEVPAGAIVSVLGAPFFLLLVMKRLRGVR